MSDYTCTTEPRTHTVVLQALRLTIRSNLDDFFTHGRVNMSHAARTIIDQQGLCRYQFHGNCKRGLNCKFRHVGALTVDEVVNMTQERDADSVSEQQSNNLERARGSGESRTHTLALHTLRLRIGSDRADSRIVTIVSGRGNISYGAQKVVDPNKSLCRRYFPAVCDRGRKWPFSHVGSPSAEEIATMIRERDASRAVMAQAKRLNRRRPRGLFGQQPVRILQRRRKGS